MLAIGLHPPSLAQRASACSLHSHYAPPHFQSCSKAYGTIEAFGDTPTWETSGRTSIPEVLQTMSYICSLIKNLVASRRLTRPNMPSSLTIRSRQHSGDAFTLVYTPGSSTHTPGSGAHTWACITNAG